MAMLQNPDKDIYPPQPGRYTWDGDDQVEARIHRDQERVAQAVCAALPESERQALILMGGYGRGEGGYVMVAGQPAPYNDYDYFIVVRGLNRWAIRSRARALIPVAKAMEKQVGVEVDFAFLREESLPKAEHSLMNAEMVWGHRVVWGRENILHAMPIIPFATLPLGEFTRLMLNRGALLLMNRARLAQEGGHERGDMEIFAKYLFKAILACGDAHLAASGAYHPSYPVKERRLQEKFPHDQPFLQLYAAALRAKFHPDQEKMPIHSPQHSLSQIITLWLDSLKNLEMVRLGRSTLDWQTYGQPSIDKGQRGHGRGGVWRHVALSLREFGPMGLVKDLDWFRRYPRERLLAALPLLLTDPTDEAPSLGVIRALNLAKGSSWQEAVPVFLRLWSRFA